MRLRYIALPVLATLTVYVALNPPPRPPETHDAWTGDCVDPATGARFKFDSDLAVSRTLVIGGGDSYVTYRMPDGREAQLTVSMLQTICRNPRLHHRSGPERKGKP